MKHVAYGELTPWYWLLDPTEAHEDEAESYRESMASAVADASSLLELGSGAGNNAFFLKSHFACTLSDISEPMLALSRKLNPECEHVVADMRTLRLDRSFDLVLIHDAIVYMATEEDLQAALATAFHHTRPGGAALFAPDCTSETFVETTDLHTGADSERELRCLEWSWQAPGSPGYTVDYAFLLRDADGVRAVHDSHAEGLFSRAKWLELIEEAGFIAETVSRPIDIEPPHPYSEEVFLARRPA